MEDSSAVSEFYRFLEEEELANEQYYRSLDIIAAAAAASTSRNLLDFSDDEEELEKASVQMMSTNRAKSSSLSSSSSAAAAPPPPPQPPLTAEAPAYDLSDNDSTTPLQVDNGSEAKAEDLLTFNALSNGSFALSEPTLAPETSVIASKSMSESADTASDNVEYNVLSVHSQNKLSRYNGDSSDINNNRTSSSDSRDDTDDGSKVTIINKFKVFGPGVYYVNLRKIDIDLTSGGYEIYIRPDVSESDVLSLAGQVLLSLCGAVRTNTMDWGTLPPGVPSSEDNRLSVIEVGGAEGPRKPSSWKEIKCCVGLNASKVRVLFILITSTGTGSAANTSATDSSIISKLDPLNIFGINKLLTASSNIAAGATVSTASCSSVDLLLDSLLEALYDNNLDITSLLYHSPYKDTSTSSHGPVSYVLDSILDPLFVKDLQQSVALEMFITLTDKAAKMDAYLRHIEKQCAKMMTVLQPSYARADLVLPTPPPPTSLAAYKLELPRKPIFDVTVDQSKLLILKSRRVVSSRSSYDNNYIGLLNDLISTILSHVRVHVDEESRARLTRRKNYSRDRALAVEGFKAELLSILDERNACVDDEIAPSDELLLTALHSRCRLLDPRSQACLLELANVVYLGRKGNAYLTREYLYFHSASTLFQSVAMKLLSLKTVRAVAVTVNGKVSVLPRLSSYPGRDSSVSDSDLFMDDRTSSILASKIANTSLPSTANSSNSRTSDGNNIVVVLPNDVFEFFYIAGPTTDYCYRVADVINLLLQMRLWESVVTPAAGTPASETSVQIAADSSSIGAEVSADEKAAQSSATPSAQHVFYCKDATFVGISNASTPIVTANSAVRQQQPVVAPKEPEKKKLAHNIQAFLDRAKTSK